MTYGNNLCLDATIPISHVVFERSLKFRQETLLCSSVFLILCVYVCVGGSSASETTFLSTGRDEATAARKPEHAASQKGSC